MNTASAAVAAICLVPILRMTLAPLQEHAGW